MLATKTLREAVVGSLLREDLENQALLFFDADDLLSQFMIKGWPDESRFVDAMTMNLMLSKSVRVRIFQEMTSLLWTQGTPDAAIRLEELFEDLISQKPIKLHCAYPLSHFSGKEQFKDKICELHR